MTLGTSSGTPDTDSLQAPRWLDVFGECLVAGAGNHHYLQLWRLSATLITLRGLIFVEVDDVLRDERVTSIGRGANAT